MSQRTIIISDIHLGLNTRGVMDAATLRPIWQGARQLIINGDAAETHHHLYRQRAKNELEKLHQLCESDGVTITHLAGNHDPEFELKHLLLAEDRILVTHGDAFHPAIAPWTSSAAMLKSEMHRLHQELLAQGLAPAEAVLEAARQTIRIYWHRHEAAATEKEFHIWFRPPRQYVEMFRYWAMYPTLANHFADKYFPTSRWVIVGHSHRNHIAKINGRVIINTGTFGFPGKPVAVIMEDDQLRAQRIVKTTGQYAISGHVLEQFDLNADNPNG